VRYNYDTITAPSYVNEDDMKHFHGTYKEICDKHDPKYYEEFKSWADRYFVIQHRNETRGLGGIFFDDQNDKEPDEHFAFSKESLRTHRQSAQERRIHTKGKGMATDAPRTICRIQLGVRSGNRFWPQDWWTNRKHPHESS
jgi:coproporphyrinogen III oxidase